MACDWSSSDGLGGIGPHVSTWRPDSAYSCRASASLTLPMSTLVVPTALSRPRRPAIRGRRRSASTRTTRWPAIAVVRARLIAVVDLPSPGRALVSTMTFCSASTSTYCMLVRSTRKASAHGVVEPRTSSGGRLAASSLAMLPRIGASVMSATSSLGGERRVEQLARHGGTDPEEQAQHARQGQVADRLRGDGGGGRHGVVDDAGPDRGHVLALGGLELLDERRQLLAVGLGDVTGPVGVHVDGGDLEDDRLGDDAGRDRVHELVGVGAVAQRVAHLVGEGAAGDQVGVGRHPLGGEQVAGVGRARVRLAGGGDEETGGGRVLRRRLRG